MCHWQAILRFLYQKVEKKKSLQDTDGNATIVQQNRDLAD